jgi:hypothetical protein
MRNTSLFLAAGIALGFAVLGSGNANADTITASGSSILNNGTTLGPGNYGTVTYTFSGTAISFDVQLNSGYQFLNTGFDAVFAFTTNIPIVYGPTPPSLIVGNGIGTWSGVGNGTGTGVGMNGAGNFGGGLDNSLSGGSNHLGDDIKFTITGAAALALVNAINSGGKDLTNFFAADICVLAAGSTTACAATGVVFDGPPVSNVPLPPAALLFGTALVGLGVLGRRRRRNPQA